MSTLALIGVFVGGCAMRNSSTDETQSRLIKLQNDRRKISERERQCLNEAAFRRNQQIAQLATARDATTQQRAQMVKVESDHQVSECEKAADRDKADLFARERAEYADQAQQGHERAKLMMILTTSGPH
jgi:hypothetical protein